MGASNLSFQVCHQTPKTSKPVHRAQFFLLLLNLCNNAAQAIDAAGRVEIETQVTEIGETLSPTHGELAPGRYARISDFAESERA
jgi:signal transduction histidine kinase